MAGLDPAIYIICTMPGTQASEAARFFERLGNDE
jgi:hypothetical protein